MFKNRAITVTVDKKNKDELQEQPEDPAIFEHKADHILRKLEKIGTKVFVGVCIYVILDTVRQVAVAQTIYPQEQD